MTEKEIYTKVIIAELEQCEDIALLDLILKLLIPEC